jgi:hypothetical protein
MRRWNPKKQICCCVAFKLFSGGMFATVETGFISPQIQEWSGLKAANFPLSFMGNGFGIFYRLEDLGIADGFEFPPGGWPITGVEERARFQKQLESQFLPKLASLLNELLTWNGWVRHFKEEVKKSPCGRGRAWALLGYSLLANPDRTAFEIEAVIEEHARQDGSKKIGNRVDVDIVRQRDLLRGGLEKVRKTLGW